MRTLSPGLAASLARSATTMCRCWRLTRKDGAVLGFTDHDAPLVFEGTRFEAASGLTASEAEAMLGLGAGGGEIEGALSSASIGEEDVAAGRYDGARVETFAVNWREPAERVLLSVDDLGEVTREGPRFRAELRGPASRLDRLRGRVYARRCDAALGDARCGVDLLAAGRRIEAGVAQGGPAGLVLAPAAGLADGRLFAGGTARVLSGRAAGLASRITGLSASADGWRLSTLEPVGAAPGDRLLLTVGCDKSFATCRDRFGNAASFRGFPHLPGSDAALRIAKKDGPHDGGPLVP